VAGRRRDVLDIREILRRFQRGQGIRAIARDLGLGRKTVAKYQDWAAREDLLSGVLPERRLAVRESPRGGLWTSRAPASQE